MIAEPFKPKNSLNINIKNIKLVEKANKKIKLLEIVTFKIYPNFSLL